LENWHCRQGALLVAKYHFAVTAFSLPSDYKLFDLTLFVLLQILILILILLRWALEHDPVDEVFFD